MPKKYLVLFSICFAAFSCLYALPPSFIIPSQPFLIDISTLFEAYDKLAVDEKEEQLRDWAFYGLLTHLGQPEESIKHIFHDNMPIRNNRRERSSENVISRGRAAILNDNDAVLLVQMSDINDKALLGSLLDTERAVFKQVPRQVHIFGYSVDTDTKALTMSFSETIAGSTVFSSAYGYFEKEIISSGDLDQFMGSVSDVTYLKWKDSTAVLGGRMNAYKNAASVSVQDIATLYQAYMDPLTEEQSAESRKLYNAYIEEKYKEVLANDKKLRTALKAGQVTRGYILGEIRKKIPFSKPDVEDVNVGFSLDPHKDIRNMSEDLIRLSKKDVEFVAPLDVQMQVLIDSQSIVLNDLAVVIKKKGDIVPLLRLINKFKVSDSYLDNRYANILQSIDIRNSYQSARYDGKLKGTGSGMILFYTDLIAKLWALDYQGLAPREKVKGFRTMPEIKVPKIHWDNFVKHSQTRLWFGLRQEGFEIQGKELRFAPIATRVYAASSDPLFPGKETKPNYQSEGFLGWWDLHYSAVADYEPYYYKLNQLQKWGCIFMVLKEEKSKAFNFLLEVPVERSLDFALWYKNAADLKIKAEIPFKDKIFYEKNTECLLLLQSGTYPLMGRNYFLSGGVSLASGKDIRKKLSKRGSSQTAKTVKNPIPAQSVSKKYLGWKKAEPKFSTKPVKKANGSFLAKNVHNKVELKWEKSDNDLLNEFVDELVLSQENKAPGHKDEKILSSNPKIEKVVRVSQWKKYLVKSSNIEDKWIQLSINEESKESDYPIKVSGTEPDSDIFAARLISKQKALNQIASSGAITIFGDE